MALPFILLGGLLALAGSGWSGTREGIQRLDITEGDTLTLTCIARPTHLRGYRWVYVREGTRKPRVLSSGRRLVIGEPRLSIHAEPEDGHVKLILQMKEIRPYEAGLFMCWRQSLKPDPQVHVRVLEAGVTEAEPLSVEISGPTSVDYGGAITIRCLIRPSWPGKVEWLRNGTVIPLEDRIYTQEVQERPEGDLMTTLMVASVRQGSTYTCRVPSSPVAAASVNVAVRVARIESLVSEPSEDSVEYGQCFSLICTVSETDEKILWIKDGEHLDLDASHPRVRKVHEILPDGNMRSTLQIEEFLLADNGQYVCYVPGDSKGIVVNIEGRPPRVTALRGWDFIVGDVLRLTCSTQYAKNDKEIKWLFEGEPLRPDWWAEVVTREDSYNVTHHDLSLPIPTRSHAGSYSCTTPYGSASTVVREIVPPYVEESPPKNINVFVGDKLSLPCSVAGYPIPTVIWEKNIDNQWKIVEEVKTEGEPAVDGIMVNTEPLVNGETRVGERQELILEEAYPFHAGKYRCRAYNEEATVSLETEVITSASQPTIVEMKAHEVTEGEDLKITCSVIDWEGPVEFVQGLHVLGQDGDARHESHLISKETKKVEKKGKGGSIYETEKTIFTHALIIFGVTLGDQGFYECQAGPEAHHSIEVFVKQLPPEVVEVAASPAVEGEEFFVSCTVARMPTDQQVGGADVLKEAVFYFNGKNLNEASDPRVSTHLAELTDEVVINSKGRAKQATYVVKVRNATREDSGEYTCVVEDGEALGSATVQVEAIEDVEEVFLESSPTWSGGSLALRCTVTKWNKDVTFILNHTIILEEDSRFYLSRKREGNSTVHTLNIFNVTPMDSGLYQCFTSPLISAEVNVTIGDISKLKLTLEQEPLGTPLWINSPLVLDCRVMGFKPYQHTIEFSHDGIPFLYLDSAVQGVELNSRASLLDSEGDEENSLDDHKLSYKMKLDAVMEDDGGTWACRATIPDAGFADEAFVKIDVYEPPKFTESPDSKINVEYGSDIILNCIASGFPVPKVSWFKDDIQQPFMNQTGFARLEITDFSEEDTGVYICQANSIDQQISSETRLEIMKELQIIEFPEAEHEISEGIPTGLRCMALSSPPLSRPFVMWYREGSEEVLTNGYEIASYTIENPTKEDAGVYVCKATVEDLEKVAFTQIFVTQGAVSHTGPPSPTLAPTLMAGRLVEISGPASVEEGEDLTLMCLVSPLLSFYKYLVVFNGTILTFDETMVMNDPRFSATFGVGGVGERLVRLTIQNVSELDQGLYECTVNTSPIAQHSHFVSVGPEGSFTTASTDHRIGISSSTETFVTPELWSSFNISDLWDITDPALIPEAGTQPPPFHRTSTQDPFEVFFPSSTHGYEVATEKNLHRTVVAGRSVTLPCTIHEDKQSSIIWRLKKDRFLISVDILMLSNDGRFEVDDPDAYTRNLIIRNTTLKDAGIYTCFKEVTPPIRIHYDLAVFEGPHGASEEVYGQTPAVPPLEGHEEDEHWGMTEVTRHPWEKGEEDESDFKVISEDEHELEDSGGEHGLWGPREGDYEIVRSEERGDEFDGAKEDGYKVEETEGDDHAREGAEEEEKVAVGAKFEEDISEGVGKDDEGESELSPVTEEPEIKEAIAKEMEDGREMIPAEYEEEDDQESFSDEDESEEEYDAEKTSSKETEAEQDFIGDYEDNLEETTLLPRPDQATGHFTTDPTNIRRVYSVHSEDEDKELLQPFDDGERMSWEVVDDIVPTEQPQDSLATGHPDDPSFTSEIGGDYEDAVDKSDKDYYYHNVPKRPDEPDEDSDDFWPVTTAPGGPYEESEEVDIFAIDYDDEEARKVHSSSEFDDVESEFDYVSKGSSPSWSRPTTSSPMEGTSTTQLPMVVATPGKKEEEHGNIEEEEEESKHRDENETHIFVPKGDETDEEEMKEGKKEELENDEEDYEYSYYTYNYYDPVTSSTEAPPEEHPVIVAEPGDDVMAPPEAEVILPCPTKALAEDITWKDEDQLLFLGSLDLAGVKGMALSPEGRLRLLSGSSDPKDQKLYTCLIYDRDSADDIPVISYWISLEEVAAKSFEGGKDHASSKGTTHLPTSTFEFPGLEWQDVAVIANSEISGASLTEVLKEGGVNAVFVSADTCRSSNEISSWDEANNALKECEQKARDSGLIRESQSVFVILDFTVALGHHKTYGLTLIFVHNVVGNLTAHVFGNLVPLSLENGYTVVECGTPVYPSQKLLDLSAFCKSYVASSLLTLQETYLTHSRKMPMY